MFGKNLGALVVWMAAAVVLLAAPAARGGTVLTLSPEAVLANTDVAFAGTVVSALPRRTASADRSIWTDYVFRVDDVVAGDGVVKAGDLYTVSILGGRIGDEEDIAHGVPRFEAGERAVVFMNSAHGRSVCPILGWWQGVYRARVIDGREVVVRADACCETGGTKVVRHFFAKTMTAPEGFTVKEFVEEARRALPEAQARPDLTLAAMWARHATGGVEEYDDRRIGVCGAGAGAASGDGSTPAAWRREGSEQPNPSEIILADRSPDDRDVMVAPRARIDNRFGFSSGAPDAPWIFNVAPNMGVFDQGARDVMGYWNSFVTFDFFRIYNNNTNTVSFGNDRNETGFLNDAGMAEQGAQSWGTSVGLCRTRSRGGEIKEADIYFNLNPGTTWTLDIPTAFASSAGMNNNPVLLFQRTAIHEFGHSFGMRHQWEPNPGARFISVMNYVPAWLRYDSASVYGDDAAGLRAAYSTPGAPRLDLSIELWYQTGGQLAPPDPANDTRVTAYSPTSVVRGSTLAIGTGTSFFTVENPGTIAVPSRVDFYLCPSWGTFSGAVYCASHNLPAVGAGGSAQFQRSVIVPAWITPGSYYVGASLVVGGDEDTNTNIAWSYAPITVTAAPPSNDHWNNAFNLGCAGDTQSSTTLGASQSVFNACNSGLGPDVFYRIVPCVTGTMIVDTCGSTYDTVVQLLNSGLGNIDCNDDAAAGPCSGSLQSYVTTAVSAGSTYFIRVAGYNQASGNFTLNVRVEPPNDACAAGQFCGPTATLPVGAAIVGTTLGATVSSAGQYPACPFNDPFFGPIPIEDKPDVWYAIDAPCNGTIRIDMDGTSQLFQTAVYDRCWCSFFSSPQLVACGQPTFGHFNPITTFNATAGSRYFVRVRNVLNPANFFIRATYSVPNDGCDPFFGVPTAATLTGAAPSASVAVNTACASPSGGVLPGACFDGLDFDPGNDVYFGLSVQTPGTLQVTRCFGSYLPSVALYTGNCSDGLGLAACGYSDSGSCAPVIISTPVLAGTSYIVRVAGHNRFAPPSGASTIQFTIVPEAGGACCLADGQCTLVGPTSCGGVYQGTGTSCGPNPCPQPTGACCVTTINCQVMTGGACAGAGGTYRGQGVPCQGDAANPITCCTANFNGENAVTVQDIFDFLAAYFAGQADADINGGGLSVQDIFDFLAAYFAGCG